MSIHITPKFIHQKLMQSIGKLEQNLEKYVLRPGKDFTRKRACTFPKMIKAIMAMETHDLDGEILSIFQKSGRKISSKELVTASAFVQARSKINGEAFPELLRMFNDALPFSKTKDGLHLLGMDGSDNNVPADKHDCNTFIPHNSNDGGYHQMHLNAAFDLLEQRYSDILVQPRANLNEVEAACTMVDRNRICGKCLYIGDRGYGTFNFMAHVMERKDYFLIRLRDIRMETSPYKFDAPPEDGEADININFIMTRDSRKVRSDPRTYKLVRKDRPFDYIPDGDKESEYCLSFRLVCVKLESGEYEYLATNLPAEKYPQSVMKEYYYLRWGIEESFLFLKYGVALNYFHSIKREFLLQEIYAKIILFNYISLLVSCVELTQSAERKYSYKVCFSDAVTVGRQYLLGYIDESEIIPLLKRYKTPIRPGRKYKRNVRSQRLRTLQHRA